MKLYQKNIDEKYFKETDYGWEYTNFYKYRLASLAKSFFKEKILELDDDKNNLQYTTYVVKSVIDKEATNKNKSKFAEQYRLLDEKYNEYRDSHLSEYEECYRVNSFDDLSDVIRSEFRPYFSNLSLKDAVQGYLCASELAKVYGKGTDEYDTLPKYKYYKSLPEFSAKHDSIKQKLRNQLSLPEDDSVFNVMKPDESVHQMKRFKKADSVITNQDIFEDFSEQFTDFIISQF